MFDTITLSSEADELKYFINECMTPIRRTMLQFAEEEIVLPTGPFANRLFLISRQPYIGLYFKERDSGRYRRFFATGPQQAGKSLGFLVIPTLYHLFEMKEDVILGVPNMNMAGDKWSRDLLPVIQKTRYAELLPAEGPGSRGGKIIYIKFSNGATLRFMSGGSDDKGIAGYTSRVVHITEVDGMDSLQDSSEESDKITGLEGRTRAYADKAVIGGECTLTTDKGRTWTEISNGTNSRIYLPCQHCGRYVLLEREDFRGWEQCETEDEAMSKASWVCNRCGAHWSEHDRKVSNQQNVLLHKGQTITDSGEIIGEAPKVSTLGFRASAVNNLLIDTPTLASILWGFSRRPDREAVERATCQYVFAVPYIANNVEEITLDQAALIKRVTPGGRGVVPNDHELITVGQDLGRYKNHWVAVAWKKTDAMMRGKVIDYGIIENDVYKNSDERATELALLELEDRVVINGWQNENADKVVAKSVWIDSGYYVTQKTVYEFCRNRPIFDPMKGYGSSQDVGKGKNYTRPDKLGNGVAELGAEYHKFYQTQDRVYIYCVNADFYKSLIHEKLSLPQESNDSIVFFEGDKFEHVRFVQHLLAETKVMEYQQGKGVIPRWYRKDKENHYLDALYIASAAAVEAFRKAEQKASVAPRTATRFNFGGDLRNA